MAQSIHQLLELRASEAPDRVVYRHLVDGDQLEQDLTLGQLQQRATTIAATLADRGQPGERVLLLYPQGLDFAPALLGAMLAGRIAVPAPVPDAAPGSRRNARLEAMLAGCGAQRVLTHSSALATAERWPRALARVEAIATDLLQATTEPTAPPPTAADDTAYLQYTSGSTAQPRGVVITHANLLANCADLNEAYRFDADSVLVSWVPAYHDLGLVYGVLMPLYAGFVSITLDPAAFVQRPIRWLQAISRHGATHSISPNFGFDLAVLRTTEAQRAGLDLRRWRVALNGAEPIRRSTEQRFVGALRPCGLSPDAISHSYGLSEATAKVTAERSGQRMGFLELDAAALEQHRVAPASGGRTATVACCGVPAGDMAVCIVDPEQRTPAGPDQVGEIWLSGASVARGYFRDPQATEQIFGATLATDPATRWLRTGDLGFLSGGALYVTGRRKDLLIVRGENHYPQDLEWSVQGLHPAIRPDCAAAFSVPGPDGEQVVLLTDVYPDRLDDPEAVFAAMREAVGAHGLSAAILGLLPPRTIPKTSSGKIQRAEARRAFLADQLQLLARWDAPRADPPRAVPSLPLEQALRQLTGEARAEPLAARIRELVAERTGLSPDEIGPDAPFRSLGVDSIAAVQLGEAVAEATALSLYPGVAQDNGTVRELVAFVLRRLDEG